MNDYTFSFNGKTITLPADSIRIRKKCGYDHVTTIIPLVCEYCGKDTFVRVEYDALECFHCSHRLTRLDIES